MSSDVSRWLHELGLGQYAAHITECATSLDDLARLTEADITKLVPLPQHRKQLKRAISVLAKGRGSFDSTEEMPLAGRTAHLGPERRYLTVLIGDLVGSTALSQQLDPEDFAAFVNSYRRICRDVVARFGGRLAAYAGDGVLAYFGWPQAYEDHAERAIRAGLQLVDGAASNFLENTSKIAIRVGIASGLVVVGTGEDILSAQDVVGEAPNIASRLQTIAAPNTVVIAPSTFRLSSRVFEYRDLGDHILKGLAHPFRVRQVLAVRTLDSRFDAYRAQDLSPFVGRLKEISLLTDLWNRVKAGTGQIMLISGEAGIGKSRLANEFRRRTSDDTANVICHQCAPLHATTPLHPVIHQLWIAAELSVDDSVDRRIEKLRRLAHACEVRGEQALAHICSLFQIRSASIAPLPDLAPQLLRKELVDTIWALMRGLCERGPVLALIEDVQWIDPMTEALWLRHFGELTKLPILLIATCRDEFRESWRRNQQTTSITLQRLSAADSRALIYALLGAESEVGLVEGIVARAEGVPLFLDELTRALRDNGEKNGSVAALWSKESIPATLQALLADRLDRLGEAKRLAQIGAVFGRQFTADALKALAEQPEHQTEQGIKHLLSSGLVKRQGRVAGGGFSFKHALVQDTAYDSLLNAEKRRLHGNVLAYFEGRRKDSIAEAVETLAFHAERGHVWDKAVRYLGTACAQAIAKSANREAIAFFDRALAALKHLPASEAAPYAVDLRRQVCPALLAMGDIDRLIAELRWADHWAREIGDKRRQAAAQSQLAMGLWLAGEHRGGLQCAEGAAQLAAEAGDCVSGILARFQLANHHHALGMVREAAGIYSSIIEALQGNLAYQKVEAPGLRSVLAHGFLAWCATDLGDFALAKRTIDRAASIIKKVPEPFSIVWVHLARGLYHLGRGEAPQAISAFEDANELNERSQMLLSVVVAWLAAAYVEGGRAGDALMLLSKAEDAVKRDSTYNRFQLQLSLAKTRLALGDTAAARDAIEEAQKIAETTEELLHLGWALKVRGDLEMAALGHGAAAERAYLGAIDIAAPRGLRPLEAHCHAGLARLYDRQGRRGDAAWQRELAASTYQRLGLSAWLERLDADRSMASGCG